MFPKLSELNFDNQILKNVQYVIEHYITDPDLVLSSKILIQKFPYENAPLT